MSDIHTQFIEISQLRIGMFVYLDVGWMDHPFPVSSFEIRTQTQLATIRGLGLEQIRYSPEKSSPEPIPVHVPEIKITVPSIASESAKVTEARLRREMLALQHSSLLACERQFSQASQTFKHVAEIAHAQPLLAKGQTEALIQEFVTSVLGEEEAAIRLLSEKAGERTSLHSINVTVISLLLGRALELSKSDMFELGVGALLHDLGKMQLPDRLRWQDEQFNAAERQLYQGHVQHSVSLAQKMGLSPEATILIAQHHEYIDGSGYPAHIKADKITPLGRIISLVNKYDNMCNPGNPALAITPHEALSKLFTINKLQFDSPSITAFIRMMGIYPPGSVVQLTDDRYALVVSVNSARPIKPSVVIHDSSIPRDDALVINLEHEPDLGIRRSLKPVQLPKAAYDYLSPRKRLCYFFERGMELPSAETTP
ncbi:MAG: HD domain-containing phosphohydrolase [Pseudomonadota bacterium]